MGFKSAGRFPPGGKWVSNLRGVFHPAENGLQIYGAFSSRAALVHPK